MGSKRPGGCAFGCSLVVFVMLTAAGAACAELVPDAPIKCQDCERWNEPQAPFRIYGNTYYVGTRRLSSILIVTDDGLILLDGALPQSASLIDANIAALGFLTRDLRLILSSHTHFDHAGGIAALQRASGATVVASARNAAALRQGRPVGDDPQGASAAFPSVESVLEIADSETITLGNVAVTAHLTPGHTPGGTTWSWPACEGARCLDVVYADSLSAVSDVGFRYTGDGDRPSIVASFRRSIERVSELPCDILLSPHPQMFDMATKLRAASADVQSNPFIDSQACRRYAEKAAAGLEKRVKEELRRPQ